VQDLVQKGEGIGVPILIILEGNRDRAALCSSDPDLVEFHFSKVGGDAARALQPVAETALKDLQRSVPAWCVGFDALRAKSHEKLDSIWDSQRVFKR
jgi:hypothetical protein